MHLLHPHSLYLTQNAWTDPLVAVTFALFLHAAGRRTAAGALALFFAAKQYSVLVLALLLAWPRHRIATLPTIAWGVLGAIAITAPLALWHPQSFIDGVLLLQIRQPFRVDSVSIPALVNTLTGIHLPGALAVVAAACAIVWARSRLPSEPYGLALGGALVYLSFFLLAKQAFENYHYTVTAFLLLAIAFRRERT
jgi:hypothetical protein